jgi:hypothetical protein
VNNRPLVILNLPFSISECFCFALSPCTNMKWK